MGEELERFYSVFPWGEDWGSYRARVEEARRVFRGLLLGHRWLQWLRRVGRVRLLDAMGGVGVGAAGFLLALRDLGLEGSATVLDLRSSALEKASLYAGRLGVRVETVEASVAVAHRAAGCPYHVTLVYGLSTPHLDPYRAVQAFASLARCLEGEEGVLLSRKGIGCGGFSGRATGMCGLRRLVLKGLLSATTPPTIRCAVLWVGS